MLPALLCEPPRLLGQPSLVGLLFPSLGALILKGGFLELARVGIGKGGSLSDIGKLGLLGRPLCAVMPLETSALRRIAPCLGGGMTKLNGLSKWRTGSLFILGSGMLGELRKGDAGPFPKVCFEGVKSPGPSSAIVSSGTDAVVRPLPPIFLIDVLGRIPPVSAVV